MQDMPLTIARFTAATPKTDRIAGARRAGVVMMLALFASLTASHVAQAQSAAAEGEKIAFDRSKGNCLTCHEMKGGTLAGSIGPALTGIKSKYPDRTELIAIVTDETKRNPQTVMPPFGRNHILTDKEISAVVDFLQTL